MNGLNLTSNILFVIFFVLAIAFIVYGLLDKTRTIAYLEWWAYWEDPVRYIAHRVCLYFVIIAGIVIGYVLFMK